MSKKKRERREPLTGPDDGFRELEMGDTDNPYILRAMLLQSMFLLAWSAGQISEAEFWQAMGPSEPVNLEQFHAGSAVRGALTARDMIAAGRNIGEAYISRALALENYLRATGAPRPRSPWFDSLPDNRPPRG